jgi:hypothetical protein
MDEFCEYNLASLKECGAMKCSEEDIRGWDRSTTKIFIRQCSIDICFKFMNPVNKYRFLYVNNIHANVIDYIDNMAQSKDEVELYEYFTGGQNPYVNDHLWKYLHRIIHMQHLAMKLMNEKE